MDLRRNLYPFMEKQEFEEIEKKFQSLPKGWNSFNKVRSIDYPIVNKTFDEVYMIFIETMKSKGLLIPKSTDVRRAIIGG
jgi:hypothetical protein